APLAIHARAMSFPHDPSVCETQLRNGVITPERFFPPGWHALRRDLSLKETRRRLFPMRENRRCPNFDLPVARVTSARRSPFRIERPGPYASHCGSRGVCSMALRGLAIL